MASSLEELLAEEGFRGRRSMTRSRTVSSDTATVPIYPLRGQHRLDSSYGNRNKTQRTRSDASRYSFRSKLSKDDSIKVLRSRDNPRIRERVDGGSRKETPQKIEHSLSLLGDRISNASSSDIAGKEIVDDDVDSSERIKDIYLNEVRQMKLDKKHGSSSKTHLPGWTQPKNLNEKSNGSSLNGKSFEDSQNPRHVHGTLPEFVPALDEVAVQATISIVTGYSKRYLKDEGFRTTLHKNCFSCLNSIALEQYPNNENKVIANLKQAIDMVEKAAEECATAKDLKRASLQLSVVTGLNSNDLKDGFTCGIPNYHLSACAHLYLSVIYKLQKKDRASAKHLLQVYSDSPFQARTTLLPELWENLFYPHLSHLKLWHGQEADSLEDTPNKERRLKLLDKVYNEILDSGTYQFAVYYKDWLTEGFEAPSIPSINIPSLSIQEFQFNGSRGHSAELTKAVGPFYAQPMVSRKLYEDVFGSSSKPGLDDAEAGPDNCASSISSGGSSIEIKQTFTYSSETVKHMDRCSVESYTKNPQDEALEDGFPQIVGEGRGSREASVSSAEGNDGEGNNSSRSQQNVDGAQQIQCSSTNTIQVKFPLEESVSQENFQEQSFSSILKHLICPLTGKLFEDPVTLETGQTYERVAISKWFDQGNRTCPMTGKTLGCSSLPLTNIVIQRVIDGWTSEFSKIHINFACQKVVKSEGHEFEHKDTGAISMLEQLLMTSDKEARIANAGQLISLGGLEYLIQRFESGPTEERKNVLELMLCCIEADASCRNQIAEGISSKFLLDLLHSKQIQVRRNAVCLLIEIICLNRRKDFVPFLGNLPNEEMVNTMHVLLLYLQSAPDDAKPLVAILLLHFDLLVEPRKYSIYREEAVDAISLALDLSLNDENVRERCCKALLVFGGHFSFPQTLSPEHWILKQEGCSETYKAITFDNEQHGFLANDTCSFENEDLAHREWLKNLLGSLLGSRRRSFIDEISKCLSSRDSNMVRVCLITVAWLSSALSSLSDAEHQLSVFSALVPQLKEKLESGERMEHKILASFSLLNFCKTPECRVLLLTMSEEITSPLRSIANVSGTAKQLYALVCGDDM
ncbi:putative E3 ubiquitin-protein ligase LIN-1 [Rhodamnia argentea]|uniref:RING-type E3 ubiquitin transferase n=1 Tax=Rhodamnia argentea TaxID=178133 RepID=A0A8B8NWM2_9MYRT|nr:putative E3 ubiquitin-protein ligase LIN-1 [Rhodamnia argentea]XP_048140491.1 putative E3 ubiquitin-protein ligase LIN-1 [Rhodamnia argentea]XP_048140492.1 putative E3 ubiquitin-protein ligase LIN-1 [Rhodamnia argentea]